MAASRLRPHDRAAVRDLFAYLRTVIHPVMTDAERRIRERVGDEPVHRHHATVKNLANRRLGMFVALQVVRLSARDRDETVSVAIGIRPDGRLATLEGTPERRQQEWVTWEPRGRLCVRPVRTNPRPRIETLILRQVLRHLGRREEDSGARRPGLPQKRRFPRRCTRSFHEE